MKILVIWVTLIVPIILIKGLEKYDINARKSWSAINLFFNTAIDANNVATFDEPWSRPGDYVLFRALKDLTCVSSACPCDVDAANGWNPY
jgi:aminomethyltransferase